VSIVEFAMVDKYKFVVSLPHEDDEDVLVMAYDDFGGYTLHLEIPFADLEHCGFRRVGKTKWKSLPEAAAILGMSVASVRRLCNRDKDKLTHRRKGSGGRGGKGVISIHKDVLKRFMESQTVNATKTAPKVFPSIRSRRKPLRHL
jgi:hypothetical protein